jgi:hypothetical protein
MIRKLKSGRYRLYSRKINPKTANAATSGRSRRAPRQRSTSVPSSTSSVMVRTAAHLCKVKDAESGLALISARR